MNSIREFEGRNVDAAVNLACKKLNITKENIKYDVISTGSSGIFSLIGRKKAKISVVVETNQSSESITSLVDEAFGVTKKKKNNFIKNKQNKSQFNKKQTFKDDTGKNNQKNTPQKKEQKQKTDNKVEKPKERTNEIISNFYNGKNSEEIGTEIINKILNYITSDFKVETESQDEVITFRIIGGESAIIIGKRGHTLEAIQYLVDKVVNKHTLERKRVQIDVEGYLEKRKENLEKMAIRMSEKVIKTGKPSTISQMSSQDRRIIHLTLKDNKDIRTQSMGEGYYRRLVIFPKRANKKRNRKQ